MGKLLTGRFGEEPGAESTEISLKDCHARLGLKPTDFVSEGPPKFFKRSFDTNGRYLVYLLSPSEASGTTLWKAGYYLLPMAALDVLRAFGKTASGTGTRKLPVGIECKVNIPPDIGQRALQWADQCQPRFFQCQCDHLEMRLDAPWALRRRWRARLRCPDRCQPTLSETI